MAISGISPAQRGFTYVWLLLAIGLVAAGLAATSEVASTAARRDKEAELLFVGNQFVRAIAMYRAAVPASQQYPQQLEDLLADKRFPNVRRYLRRVYSDPMTGSRDWGLVRGPNGGIVGVYSTSNAQPLKTANFPKDYAAFAGAASYRDWVFAAGGATAGSTPGGTSPTTTPSVPGAPGGPSPITTPFAPGAPGGPSPITTPSAPGAASAAPQGPPAVRVPR